MILGTVPSFNLKRRVQTRQQNKQRACTKSERTFKNIVISRIEYRKLINVIINKMTLYFIDF